MLTRLLNHYGFWLAVVSLVAAVAERIRPWRPQQPVLRPQLLQDLFWFGFNGYALGLLIWPLIGELGAGIDRGFTAVANIGPQQIQLLARQPLWIQLPALLLAADLVEWMVHNLLHRLGPLWLIHRVHHSIHDMDWIGNFRFHFLEVVLYQGVKHLPLALLGADPRTLLVAGVLSTLIGHLNHANLAISWGPGRFLLNSPRMHIWHHEAALRGRAGVNFGVVFSVWDWVFGTAYMPGDGSVPQRLGFADDGTFPDALWRRFLLLPRRRGS